MYNSKTIREFKKDITKNYVKYDNEVLIEMLNDNKKDEVVNSLLPLVIYVSNTFYNIGDFEELISAGNIGLLKGIDKFDISKGDNIVSFCRNHIRYEILNYINLNKDMIRLPQSKKLSSQKTRNNYPTMIEVMNIQDLSIEDSVYTEVNLNRRELEELLMTIPKMKYSKVMLFLDYYLIPGMTYEKVSTKNGFSKQNTSLIIIDILDKIRNNPTILEKFREILLP